MYYIIYTVYTDTNTWRWFIINEMKCDVNTR